MPENYPVAPLERIQREGPCACDLGFGGAELIVDHTGSPEGVRPCDCVGKTQHGTTAHGLPMRTAASTMASVAWSGCMPTSTEAPPQVLVGLAKRVVEPSPVAEGAQGARRHGARKGDMARHSGPTRSSADVKAACGALGVELSGAGRQLRGMPRRTASSGDATGVAGNV